MKKVALALSGGGSKGAWTVGALDALSSKYVDLKYRVVLGTSTGALIAPLFGLYAITRDRKYINRLLSIYSSVKTEDILSPRYRLFYKLFGEYGSLVANLLFGGTHIYDVDPLTKLIETSLSDADWKILLDGARLQNDPVEVGFCSVSLQTGESKLFTTRTHADKDDLKSAIIASVNQPVFMPPVSIQNQQWVDGGVIDYLPVEHVFRAPFIQDIDTVLMFTVENKNNHHFKKFDSILSILERTLSILTYQVGLEDLKSALLWNFIVTLRDKVGEEYWDKFLEGLPAELQHLGTSAKTKKCVGLRPYSPELPIEGDGLTFDPDTMKNLITKGRNDFFYLDRTRFNGTL